MISNMKDYKLVNCREFESKAKRLGYVLNEQIGYRYADAFVFLYNGMFYTANDLKSYSSPNLEEITQKDFLALPEPLKVGDWVKYRGINSENKWIIFKIDSLHADFYVCEHNNSYDKTYCDKLTQEQIEVLGLEG